MVRVVAPLAQISCSKTLATLGVCWTITAAATITMCLMSIEVLVQILWWAIKTCFSMGRRLYVHELIMVWMINEVAIDAANEYELKWIRENVGERCIKPSLYMLGWKMVREIGRFFYKWAVNVDTHPEIGSPILNWSDGVLDTAKIIFQAMPGIEIE